MPLHARNIMGSLASGDRKQWGTTTKGDGVCCSLLLSIIMPTRKQITRLIKKADQVLCNDIPYRLASFNVARSVPEGHVVLTLKALGHFDLLFTMNVLMRARVIDNTTLVIDGDTLVFMQHKALEVNVPKIKSA
jgi:hypothetical protein